MARQIIFTPNAAKPPATYSQAVLKISIAAIAEA